MSASQFRLSRIPMTIRVFQRIFAVALAVALAIGVCWAQNQQGQSSGSQGSQQPSGQQQNQQNAPPEAGGPQGDIGPIAVPKKKAEEPKKEETPKPPKKIEGMPDFSIRVNVPLVNIDVGVMIKDGMFVPGLKKENFRIMEDGVPQTIANFNQQQAPITAVMLVEFANSDYFYQFEYDSLVASYTFVNGLKKEDWIALVSYDIRERILQDFTQDKRAIAASLSGLRPGMAMSRETNLFDALYDTIDRLETVEGRKYIILVSSGRDTFSKRTLDHILKKVQASKDIVIYSIGTGQALRNWAETHGYMQYLCEMTDFNCRMTFSQADNQMQSTQLHEREGDGCLADVQLCHAFPALYVSSGRHGHQGDRRRHIDRGGGKPWRPLADDPLQGHPSQRPVRGVERRVPDIRHCHRRVHDDQSAGPSRLRAISAIDGPGSRL